jgi:hypothetical protein
VSEAYYPAGAMNDPRAPWNAVEDPLPVCTSCDVEAQDGETVGETCRTCSDGTVAMPLEGDPWEL